MKNKIVIIILLILFVVVCGLGFILTKKDKGNNTFLNNTKINEELLNIIGLTKEGYKRIDSTDDIKLRAEDKEKIKSGNYVFYNEFSIIGFFMNLDEGKEIIIKDLPKEKIKELIYDYAMEKDLIKIDALIDDGTISSIENLKCIEYSGVCDGLNQSDYNNIAKIYGLSLNASDYFEQNEIYKQYYLFETNGMYDMLSEINDDLKQDDLTIIYNINIKYADNNINKELKFNFKQENNNYYLYSVIVNNK